MNLAVYPSGHGYGHLTRTLEVVREMKRFHPDLRVHIRAPFSPRHIEEALGFLPESHIEVRLDIGLVQIDSLHHDHEASLAALKEFFGEAGERLLETESAWLRSASIDAALIDIPPHAAEACRLAGVPAYALGNFSWDVIWESYLDSRPDYEDYVRIARGWYGSIRTFYSGEMDLPLPAFSSVERVPLIARRSTLAAAEVRELLGIDSRKPVVLLAFGGEGLKGLRGIDERAANEFQLVATPPLPNLGESVLYVTDEFLHEKGIRYCDLVHAADIAMIKPGYSTVAECAANQTAVLHVPREGFIEADVIGRWIEENLPSEVLDRDDFQSGRWATAIFRLWEKSPFLFKPLETNGAEVVARRLLEETGFGANV